MPVSSCIATEVPTAIDIATAVPGCSGQRRVGVVFAASCMLLFLAGCTKVGPDFVKPDAPIAEQWTETGQLQLTASETDHAKWWNSFNDPVLDKLIDEAYN